jgi:hypothetical protein
MRSSASLPARGHPTAPCAVGTPLQGGGIGGLRPPYFKARGRKASAMRSAVGGARPATNFSATKALTFSFPSPRAAAMRLPSFLPLPGGERVGVRGTELETQISDPPHPTCSRCSQVGLSPTGRGKNGFSFSRCDFASELWQTSDLNRHRRFHSALHAKLQQANAGGSIGKRRFGADDERARTEEPKEKIGSRTPTDAIRILPWLRPRPPLSTGRRTSIGVPPRFSPKGLSSSSAQLQARLPGTWRGHVLRIPLSGRYPPLPVPVQRASRTLVVVLGG